MTDQLAADSLARDYDHFAQQYVVDPYGFWAALREEQPVARSECHGGFWVVSRYADITAAARDTDTFSSAEGTGTPPIPMRLLPIDTDPPLHREYRRIINPSFTPQAVLARVDEWRTLAREIIDQLPASEEVELCRDFALPFPQWVALRVIGFPDDDRADLSGWIDDITRLRGIDDAKVGEASVGVMMRIMQRLAERRDALRSDASGRDSGASPASPKADSGASPASPEANDMISVLLDAEIEGRPLGEDELLFSLTLLLLGGLDTTTSAIAMAFYHLADHPEDRARLLAEPELLDPAVEEFVRVATPVQGLGRTVTKDTTLSGCPLAAGDRVFLLWASGNRDPEAFDRPDEVVIDRHPNHHLGFGAGPHHCVGSHLGKLMVKIALEELLPRFGDFRIADRDRLVWVGGETRGLRTLPLQIPRGLHLPPPTETATSNGGRA